MKVFILSDAGNIHTKRWVSSLAERNLDIFLFSFGNYNINYYKKYTNIQVFCYNITNNLNKIRTNGAFEKIKYLKVIFTLKDKIKEFAPDILHAHYASSYGLLGALAGFHPYVISVWGSDIYDFPKVSFLHKNIIKYNLRCADVILSTSHNMAIETQKYTNKTISITPFGVDTELFNDGIQGGRMKSDEFVIGNIKSLYPKYGIDILIKSFKRVLELEPDKKISLQIIGDGEEKAKLQTLASELQIEDRITFLGKIENHLLPKYYSLFSVFVVTSILNSESFGVVAVEAMSCQCPVVASATDGFEEVVDDGITGLIVPVGDIEKTARAIVHLINNPQIANEMGLAGRERVLELYNWNDNVDKMLQIYKNIKK